MGAKDKVKPPKWFKQLKNNRNFRFGIWTGLFFVLMLVVLSIHFIPERTKLEVGDVCPTDIQSEFYMTFLDEKATLERQEAALKDFEDIYKIDLSQYNSLTIAEISNYFSAIEEIVTKFADYGQQEDLSQEQEAGINQKIAELKSIDNLSLTDDEWRQIAAFDENTLNGLQNRAVNIASNVMSSGVLAENLQVARNKILNDVAQDSALRGVSKKLVGEILDNVNYQATYVYDREATEARKREILSGVDSVQRVIQKGQLVVGKGEVITEDHMEILEYMGYTTSASSGIIVLGLAVLLALIIVVSKIYLENFAKEIYQNERLLVLLMLIVFITIVLYKLILSIELSPVPERAEQVGYLIPVAMGTMLIAVLLDGKLAIMVNTILAAFVGLYTGAISFMVVAIASGIVSVIGVSNLSQRSDLSKTALLIAVVNTVAITAMGLINNLHIDVILTGIVFGIFNGLFSSILTLGILPFLENMFGVTTSIKLLELANPSQPLLKKLLQEAPGTYHHSIMVGNLGEAAAEAIGANGLVVRIGAYYHDIGKTKRPYFFSENQFSAENPHDKITPTLSTLILTSHVKDGVEMAQEAHLPPIIVDMIAQHHGTTLVGFFYQKAKESGEDVREEDFRYDQKKPQTKEAAILMMADTIEAAVRSKKNATPGQIEGFIRALIKGKLNDGQFDECDLTFKDLDKVAQAFVHVTNGIYHKRVEYPDQNSMLKQNKGKKGKTNVNNNQQ